MADTARRSTESPFRQHTEQPALSSPLLGQLCREWTELHRSPEIGHLVASWGRTSSTLARLDSAGAVVDFIDHAAPPVKDQALRDLLRLLHEGDRVAGRVVLQAMLPCLTNLARRCRPPRGSGDTDEQLQRTISEFWTVICENRSLPARGVSARLQLDTLKRVTSHRRSPDAWEEHTTYHGEAEHRELVDEAAVDPAVRPSLSLVIDHPERAGGYDSDAGLYELVIHARAAGVLSTEEAQFLVDVYLTVAGQSLHDAAHRVGVSPSAVRQRCSRIRRRLIAAVVEDGDPRHSLARRPAQAELIAAG